MAAPIKPLWRISVHTSPEAEDVVSAAMTDLFHTPASVYADVETSQTVASVYVARVPAKAIKLLRQQMSLIAKSGLDAGPGTISTRRVRREDWAESWKRHFKPLEISPRLLVKPSWSTRKAKRGQAVVTLDPGLSFGTGQHPTTAFCLEQLAERRRDDRKQSMLDVGCGSGILAIAAVKLGYHPVEAFDFDPDAVRVARENAAQNSVILRIARRDLTKLPVENTRRFDIVCANLTYDLLISQRDKLLGRLADDGVIVLAGILNEQFPAVEKAFAKASLKHVSHRSIGEWRSGAFVRRP